MCSLTLCCRFPGLCRRLLLLLAMLLASGCETPPPGPVQGETMGTVYTVRLGEGPAAVDRETFQAAIEAELDAVNRAMSGYRADSEISGFNVSQSTDWYPVSAELAGVVRAALDIGGASDGALDIRVAPLVGAWGFGPAGPVDEPPRAEVLAGARRNAGAGQVEVRLDPPALRKSSPALQLDLGAIAKGHGVDRLAALLEQQGLSNFLVEIGGELRTRGRRADGGPWRIGIERPVANERRVQQILAMASDGAVATSGDYRNFFETDGARYSHIIDPRSGRPVDTALASVSVIAADCTTADGWATALSVLGPARGWQLAEERGLAAAFISRSDAGLQEQMTSAFSARLQAGQAAMAKDSSDD